MAPTRPVLRTCGTIGLVGCIGVVACDLTAWAVVEGYNPASQSISALAAGEASWIIDLGLWLFAAACTGLAIGVFRWRLDGAYWTAAGIALALLGIDVAAIALLNEYAGQENTGADAHRYAVYALWLLFALACLLVVPGLGALHRSSARLSRNVGIAWIVLAPLLLFVPADLYGAYERFLGLILVGWVAAMSSLLLRATNEAFA